MSCARSCCRGREHELTAFTAMCLNDTARQDPSNSKTHRLPRLSCLRPLPCRATQHRGRLVGPPVARGQTDRATRHDGHHITSTLLSSSSTGILFMPSFRGLGVPIFGTALGEFPGTHQNGWFSRGSGWVEDTIADTVNGHSFNGAIGCLLSHLHRL